MTYLDELSRELGAHGIRGRRRRRILAEIDDHLRSDPDAHERIGPSRPLANEFAADLGTRATRRAVFVAFGALAVAGLVYAASFATATAARHSVGPIALGALVVAPQVAFVAGVLALASALRSRGRLLATAELVAMHRRTGVALGFGVVTMAALGITASAHAPVAAGAATVLLAIAALPVARAARLRPQVAGAAGDLFDDLGLRPLRTDLWPFAFRVAAAVGAAVWLAGIAQSDPIDGLLRGVLESAACLAGFAALGGYLGLRR